MPTLNLRRTSRTVSGRRVLSVNEASGVLVVRAQPPTLHRGRAAADFPTLDKLITESPWAHNLPTASSREVSRFFGSGLT